MAVPPWRVKKVCASVWEEKSGQSLSAVVTEGAADEADMVTDDRLGAAARAWVVAHRRWADNGPRYAEIIRNL